MGNASPASLEKVGIWIVSNSINKLACMLRVMLLRRHATDIIWPFTNSCNYVVIKIKPNENMQRVFMDVTDSTPVIKAVKIHTAHPVLIYGILEMLGYLMLKYDSVTFSFRNCCRCTMSTATLIQKETLNYSWIWNWIDCWFLWISIMFANLGYCYKATGEFGHILKKIYQPNCYY